MTKDRENLIRPETKQSAGLLDVHLHFVPTVYRELAVASGFGTPDGMPGIPAWSETSALNMMEQIGITRGILSISSPGIHFGDDAVARDLARRVNDEGARLKSVHTGRFGLFASVPLPDVDGALREMEYALDTLGADGINLQSNAGGIYPGESSFDPFFAELNRRQAVVFIHPTSPACPCCGPRERPLPRPVLEFMFETTRAVASLILTGTLKRYPDIKIIVPHAGATLPVLADRLVLTATMLPHMTDLSGEEVLRALGKLYYDVAGAATPRQLAALRTLADPSRLFYGSDWPHTPLSKVAELRLELEEFLISERKFLDDVYHRNAKQLFPHL